MDEEIYKPSMIVAKLAAKLHATPIRERIELDGRITILFADGRKMYFDKDAITRTLTEPESATPEHIQFMDSDVLELMEHGLEDKQRKRKSKKEI